MRIKRIGCLILLTILITFILPAKTTSSVELAGNTYGNIANYGLVAQSGDYIYYSNSYDKWRLYSVKVDNTENKRLTTDSVQYINIVDSKVYFSNSSDNGRLYVIGTDGSGRKKLNDTRSEYINVVGDYIYYIDADSGWNIKRMKKDGTSVEVLSTSKCTNLAVTSDWIYYINWNDNFRIHRMKIDGTDDKMIAQHRTNEFVLYGNEIYMNVIGSYFNMFKLTVNDLGLVSNEKITFRSLSEAGKENLPVPRSINVHNDILYFTDLLTGHLYSLDLKNKDAVPVLFRAGPTFLPNVVGDWIYFSTIYDEQNSFIYYDDLQRVSYDGKIVQNKDVMRDAQIASEVEKTINNLPLLSQIKLTDKSKVESARAAYNALTANQKKHVTNLSVLTNAENRLYELEPKELKSKNYSIVNTSNLISKIEPGTSVSSVLNDVKSATGGTGTIEVFKADNTKVTSGNIGTGFKVRLKVNNKIEDEKTVVIYGDVSGDGKINSIDMTEIKLSILKRKTLTGVYKDAANLYYKDNEVINSLDMTQLKLHILKRGSISQSRS